MKREHSYDLLSLTLHSPVAAFSRKMEGEYENISPKTFPPASNETPTLVTAHILSHVNELKAEDVYLPKMFLKMRLPPLANNVVVYPLYLSKS